MQWHAMVHPDDLGRLKQNFSQHVEGRSEVAECEYRMRSKDGSWRWIVDRGHIIDDGTVFRLAEAEFRLCTAERQLDWLRDSAIGYLAAISSLISIPSPGRPLPYMKPLRISAMPGNISCTCGGKLFSS